MPDRSSARWRVGFGWLVTLGVIAYAVSDWGDEATAPAPAPTDELAAPSPLQIVALSDAEVAPGDAIVVDLDGADAAPPVEVRIARRPAEILVRHEHALVVRVPGDLGPGRAPLRLVQGERRSKSWDLQVHVTRQHKWIGRLLGGLALFVYGLGLLGLGLRGLAGHRVRAQLGRMTRAPAPAVAIGVLVGGVSQLTTSAAALTVGLVDARLLALSAAIPIFVGAQLGASITGAFLPLGFTHESLLLIAIGVLWTRLAVTRWGAAVARVALGAGLMLYGVHLLQTSVEPLFADPKILPYVSYLRDDGIAAHLTCAATGALLSLILLGPGPVYGLVIGLAQASGALSVENGLAILAGTNLGAAIGMALVAWQAGPRTRPLVWPHVAFGATATAFVLVTLPLWAQLAALVPAGHPGALDAAASPHVSVQLAVGFTAAQLAVATSWLAVLPVLVRRAARRSVTATPSALPPDAVAERAQRALATAFDRQRAALGGAFDMSRTGVRALGARIEEALADARRIVEGQHAAVGGPDAEPRLEGTRRVVMATLQLQRALEHLLGVAELGLERGLRLSDDEQARLGAMHDLAQASFAAVIEALDRSVAPDLEAAGGREIRMNVLEAEARVAAVASPRRNESTSVRLGLAELIDTYEHAGNHLYRVCKAMSPDADDELD